MLSQEILMEKSHLMALLQSFRTARSARMVGWAMNASHNRDDVPAHRVNRNGLLTGKFHFDGTNLMQQLLESEGIVVVENQIIDLEKHFWEPEIEVLVSQWGTINWPHLLE
jgi:methylated-DNA-protein-cysteine methyltransferase-like protein